MPMLVPDDIVVVTVALDLDKGTDIIELPDVATIFPEPEAQPPDKVFQPLLIVDDKKLSE